MTTKKHHIFIRSKLSGMCFFFGIVFLLTPLFSFEQCIATIKNFPYNENFEASNGNWVAGGSAPDWAWGAPSKPVINAAGGGSKCWITGGLSKSSYNDGENSWLRSPCFDFTNLGDPYIKFKVFWETEGKYDGANLQYSIDNGATWQLVGRVSDNNTCLTENWYNVSSLANLSGQDAWSGNIQSSRPGCFVGGGSTKWVTAGHDMPNLAGIPGVMFRFVFASGTSCNDFDGFAIDDFTIEEAPAGTASFRYNCSSSLRVNFTSTSSLCPTSYVWNFGDPSSGGDNISHVPNPTHAYTIGGKYDVSLTVSGPGNNSATYTLPGLEIIGDVTASVVIPLRCNGDSTGSVTSDFTGDSSDHFYWDSDPVQTTQTAINLRAGKYNITITNDDGCPASANVILTEPPPMKHTLTIVKPACTVSNGSIDVAISGGSPPYAYNWFPAVSNTASAKNIPAGIYTVTVTDNNQCSKMINVTLPAVGDLEADIIQHRDVSCFGGNDGMAEVSADGGDKPYIYSWSPSGGNAAIENNLAAGNFNATVTDAKGCKAFATAVINQPEALALVVTLQNTFCGKSNGNASAEVHGGVGPYQFNWNPGNYTNASISNLAPGQYVVNIKDKNGCIKTDTAMIAPSTPVHLQLSHTDVLCAGEQTGTAEAVVTGGTAPYRFQWTNGTDIFDENTIKDVGADTYNFSMQDAVGCAEKASVIITEPEPLKIELTTEPSYCDFSNGSANATVSGGTIPYAFSWSPSGAEASTLANVTAGDYYLTVTDKNSCSTTLLTTIINNKPENISLGNDTTLCPGDKIILTPGIYSKYLWQDNSEIPAYTVTKEGTYSVGVTDDLGCVIKDTIKITADCGFIFFPTAFTPNNDLHNDLFGPFGNLSTVKDYTLIVYDRLGQMVFKSNDPFKKWDGKVQNKGPQTATYVWIARFSNKGVTNIMQKGTVTIVY